MRLETLFYGFLFFEITRARIKPIGPGQGRPDVSGTRGHELSFAL